MEKIEMSTAQALNIATDLLQVVSKLLRSIPIKISTLISEGEKKEFIKITFLENLQEICYYTQSVDEKDDSVSYIIKDGSRTFKIAFYDEPDFIGYNSIIPNYDPETYIMCEVVEIYNNGETKYDFIFGFNIEEMRFEELFEVCYQPIFPSVILKEVSYANLAEIENELRKITM